MDEAAARVRPKEVHAGAVAVLVQFLELLVAFIGAALTLRIARELWPELSLNDLDFGMKGDT